MKMKKELAASLVALLLVGIGAVTLWQGPAEERPPGSGAAIMKGKEGGGETVSPLTARTPEEDKRERRRLADPPPGAPGGAEEGHALRVEGVVRNDRGEPLAGALVRSQVHVVSGEAGRGKKAVPPRKLRTTETDRDGTYRFTCRRPPAGSVARLLVSAVAGGHAPGVRGTEFSPASTRVVLDLVLPKGVVASGRVVDGKGKPIAGALVWNYIFPEEQKAALYHHADGLRIPTFRREGRPVETDQEGRFRLDFLDPRRPQHYLQAAARGYRVGGVSVPTRGEAKEREVVITLKRGALVQGRVLSGGRPVAGALVSTWKGKGDLQVKSDGEGRFFLWGLGPGRRQLEIEHPDYAPAVKRIEVPGPGQSLEITVSLVAGGRLAGRVCTGGSQPIPGAKITAFGRGKGRDWGGGWDRTATTDGEGRFELRGLPAGQVSLHCTAEGFQPLVREDVPAAGSDLVLTLLRGAMIAGRVVDGESGEPIRSFTVRFIRPAGGVDKGAGRGGGKGKKSRWWRGWRKSFRTPDGRWDTREITLAEGFATGLEIRAEGYAAGFVDRVRARFDPRPEELEVGLGPGTTLVGRLLAFPGAEPVAEAVIRVVRRHNPLDTRDYEDRGHPLTRSDGEGRFRFGHLAPGPIRLALEHPDLGLLLHPLELAPGTPRREETIYWDEQATLEGRILDEEGRPAAGAVLLLRAVAVPGLAFLTRTTRADEEGRFAFTHLPAGRYHLGRRWKGGAGKGKGLVDMGRYLRLGEKELKRVELGPRGTAKVRGAVRFDGVLPPTMTVTAYLLPPAEKESPSRGRGQAVRRGPVRQGRFRLVGLEPGRYRLEFGGWNEETREWVQGSTMVELAGHEEKEVEVELRALRK